MAKIYIAPTGRLTEGHVMDVGKRGFERALRDYDHLLYVKWNPKKLHGWGCWEIRRRPETKSIVRVVEYGGATIQEYGYRENNMIHHVLDCAFLNYDQLNKIKSMDTTNINQKYWVDQMESREKAYVAEQNAKRTADMKYAAKQNKSAINDYKQLILSGLNPAEIARYWGK